MCRKSLHACTHENRSILQSTPYKNLVCFRMVENQDRLRCSFEKRCHGNHGAASYTWPCASTCLHLGSTLSHMLHSSASCVLQLRWCFSANSGSAHVIHRLTGRCFVSAHAPWPQQKLSFLGTCPHRHWLFPPPNGGCEIFTARAAQKHASSRLILPRPVRCPDKPWLGRTAVD